MCQKITDKTGRLDTYYFPNWTDENDINPEKQKNTHLLPIILINLRFYIQAILVQNKIGIFLFKLLKNLKPIMIFILLLLVTVLSKTAFWTVPKALKILLFIRLLPLMY
jgi:hypothetical protein